MNSLIFMMIAIIIGALFCVGADNYSPVLCRSSFRAD